MQSENEVAIKLALLAALSPFASFLLEKKEYLQSRKQQL